MLMSLAWPIDVGHSIGKRANWHILHIFLGVDLVATRPVLNRFQDLGDIRLHNYSVANTRTINDRWSWCWSSCNKTCFELVSRFCEFDTFYIFEGCNNVASSCQTILFRPKLKGLLKNQLASCLIILNVCVSIT